MTTKHTLPPLPYAYDALEPHIDEATMRIHHTKHHQTYVDKLNAALEKHPALFGKSVAELVRHLETVPEDIRGAVRNHGGGHWNHTFFWESMTPGGSELNGKLKAAIIATWGGFEEFKQAFTTSALNLFGSGWTWLVDCDGKLEIINTPNQDNPLTSGKTVILGIDLWEHAMYLRYQNRRAEYLGAWWNVVDWRAVERRYEHATTMHSSERRG
jgi:Fe-Mn family superoxide dismutase